LLWSSCKFPKACRITFFNLPPLLYLGQQILSGSDGLLAHMKPISYIIVDLCDQVHAITQYTDSLLWL
jgi:hypothetical protein